MWKFGKNHWSRVWEKIAQMYSAKKNHTKSNQTKPKCTKCQTSSRSVCEISLINHKRFGLTFGIFLVFVLVHCDFVFFLIFARTLKRGTFEFHCNVAFVWAYNSISNEQQLLKSIAIVNSKCFQRVNFQIQTFLQMSKWKNGWIWSFTRLEPV